MIEKNEYEKRLNRIIEILEKKGLKAVLIYYDELNIANGWYISGWCPQFESGAVLVTVDGYTSILGGPESEEFAKMDSTIKETKNIPVFMVPDEEYPYADIIDFKTVFTELFPHDKVEKLGIVGMNSMPLGVYNLLLEEIEGVQLVDITEEYERLRVIKSEYEMKLIERAYEITDAGFKEMLHHVYDGVTETAVAGVGEGTCRKWGANNFGFQTIVAAGRRSNGVVPTASERRVKEGDLVLLGLSARYRGYSSSAGFSQAAGTPTKKQLDTLKMIAEAYVMCREMLKPGMVGRDNYAKIKKFFADRGGYEKYIICPFVHTIGLLEAEAPFFGPNSDDVVKPNMALSIDVSLWNVPEVHGVRVETGFKITENGYEPFSPFMDRLIEGILNW